MLTARIEKKLKSKIERRFNIVRDYMLAFYLTFLDDENDAKLFENLFYTYRKQMVSQALSILSNIDDAEDVVHDVFLRIATKNMSTVRAIKVEKDLRNYLLKATRNTSLNMLKRKRTYDSLNKSMEVDFSSIENLSDDSFVEKICRKFDCEKLTEVIKSMNEPYRYVLYYHFVMELTIPEVAKQLGRSVPTTKRQLVRGKKILLHLLEMEGVENYANDQG